MNQLIFWKDMAVFWGKNPKAITKHCHPAIQMVLAMEGAFTSKNENGEWGEKKALLIAPNHAHECNAQGIHILSIEIDTESAFGEWILKNQLQDQTMIDFPQGSEESLAYENLFDKFEHQKWDELRVIIENLFDFKDTYQASPKDERINKVIHFITNNINEPITTEKLTEVSCLSESRLLHLFKESMGLPIRNYILWYRLKMVLYYITKGYSLTKAAYASGFADQAHMTRTCVKMLGLPPSALSKNSKFIQVSFPER